MPLLVVTSARCLRIKATIREGNAINLRLSVPVGHNKSWLRKRFPREGSSDGSRHWTSGSWRQLRWTYLQTWHWGPTRFGFFGRVIEGGRADYYHTDSYYMRTRALHWVPMPMGFGWAWVGMAAILLFMGGHSSCMCGHGCNLKGKYRALMRTTSHTRLRARDMFTSSTLIGGKAELVQVCFTICLRDYRSMWMQDGCKVYMDFYIALNE